MEMLDAVELTFQKCETVPILLPIAQWVLIL